VPFIIFTNKLIRKTNLTNISSGTTLALLFRCGFASLPAYAMTTPINDNNVRHNNGRIR
jgi:hypothetical protein